MMMLWCSIVAMTPKEGNGEALTINGGGNQRNMEKKAG